MSASPIGSHSSGVSPGDNQFSSASVEDSNVKKDKDSKVEAENSKVIENSNKKNINKKQLARKFDNALSDLTALVNNSATSSAVIDRTSELVLHL